MKIPKRFKLMGRTVEVEYSDTLSDREDARGRAHYRDDKIILQAISPTYTRTQANVEQTFCHELMHWIMYMMEENDLRCNEKFIEVSSGLLHQALITMEYDDEK